MVERKQELLIHFPESRIRGTDDAEVQPKPRQGQGTISASRLNEMHRQEQIVQETQARRVSDSRITYVAMQEDGRILRDYAGEVTRVPAETNIGEKYQKEMQTDSLRTRRIKSVGFQPKPNHGKGTSAPRESTSRIKVRRFSELDHRMPIESNLKEKHHQKLLTDIPKSIRTRDSAEFQRETKHIHGSASRDYTSEMVRRSSTSGPEETYRQEQIVPLEPARRGRGSDIANGKMQDGRSIPDDSARILSRRPAESDLEGKHRQELPSGTTKIIRRKHAVEKRIESLQEHRQELIPQQQPINAPRRIRNTISAEFHKTPDECEGHMNRDCNKGGTRRISELDFEGKLRQELTVQRKTSRRASTPHLVGMTQNDNTIFRGHTMENRGMIRRTSDFEEKLRQELTIQRKTSRRASTSHLVGTTQDDNTIFRGHTMGNRGMIRRTSDSEEKLRQELSVQRKTSRRASTSHLAGMTQNDNTIFRGHTMGNRGMIRRTSDTGAKTKRKQSRSGHARKCPIRPQESTEFNMRYMDSLFRINQTGRMTPLTPDPASEHVPPPNVQQGRSSQGTLIQKMRTFHVSPFD